MAIITISRGTFSGGKMLAERVAQELQYKCVAREVLVEASKRYGMAAEKLEHALKDKPGMFERMGRERLQSLAYIGAALCAQIKNERVVYHGNAGQLLLRAVPHVLRIRIIADMEYRIQAAMAQRQCGRAEALRFISRADEARARWTKFMFHEDLNDSSLYDMVINLERTDLSGACELVCHVARTSEFQPTAVSQKALDDLCLKTHLQAVILADETIRRNGMTLDVSSKIVTLGGMKSSHDTERIRRLISQEPEVKDIVIAA